MPSFGTKPCICFERFLFHTSECFRYIWGHNLPVYSFILHKLLVQRIWDNLSWLHYNWDLFVFLKCI